ncbi:MAG: tRNA (adenosine(37)-N6)-dimethylallyltransferase MiaA, partial [Lentisphaeraceae bacterium]|nr:tRNA (adenosine(37)-N6)-dimethylallyltransferase MiaA [Lentisphaeraceae bacterium]
QQLKEKGIKVLQAILQQHDPKSYQHIDINNPQRVIRALEISIGTGVSSTSRF